MISDELAASEKVRKEIKKKWQQSKKAKTDLKEGRPTHATATALDNNAIQAISGQKKKKA